MTTTDSSRVYALGAYRTASLQTRDPRQTLLMVHEALRRDLTAAKSAYEAGALDRMCRHIESCGQLLTALTCKLDFAAAGAGGKTLLGFYRDLQRGITKAPRQHNVSQSFQYMINAVQMMCEEMRNQVGN
ncbi:MAG: flagellar protein FliS [Caulobacter sp.]|nr:flagellar protein FliS [Caulobacter sp.]